MLGGCFVSCENLWENSEPPVHWLNIEAGLVSNDAPWLLNSDQQSDLVLDGDDAPSKEEAMSSALKLVDASDLYDMPAPVSLNTLPPNSADLGSNFEG